MDMAAKTRTIFDRLLQASEQLKSAGSETPVIDARLLMQHATGFSHVELISKNNQIVSEKISTDFNKMIEARISGKSVHRIIGYREFLGHSIKISKDTLEPRPDTEVLVERIISDYPDTNQPLKFADVGTGTGAIAIALLKQFPNARAIAIDISCAALETANQNAQALGVSTRFFTTHSNYLEALDDKLDFLVSNPPYIRSAEIEALPVTVRNHDPRISLDGGVDGLDAYRTILSTAKQYCPTLHRIYFEIGYDQAKDIHQLAHIYGWQVIDQTRDLQNQVRVITIGQVGDY